MSKLHTACNLTAETIRYIKQLQELGHLIVAAEDGGYETDAAAIGMLIADTAHRAFQAAEDVRSIIEAERSEAGSGQ